MINSKQRAFLRSEASKTDAIFQIGKGGVDEAVIKTVCDALEARELIKLTVLENSEYGAKEISSILAEKTSSEVVSVIGRKVILYKQSSKEEKRKISLMI